jgi:hypothetical protein
MFELITLQYFTITKHEGDNMKKLLVLILLFSGIAICDDGLEDLQAGCKDPGRFGNQIPPSEIKITCDDSRLEWLPTGHDDAEIHNKRTVCSKAVTSKPNVKAPSVCEPCDWPGSDFECGGFRQVEKEVSMQFSVTCDQVLAMEGINKFCQAQMLAEVAATKEEILSVKETGKTFNTCTQKIYMSGKPTEEKPPVSITKH